MRPTWVEIKLESIKSNFNLVRDIVGNEVSILAIVKADAYGHGAINVSSALGEVGVNMLGVATVEEGVELRETGIKIPIVLLGAVQDNEISEVIQNNICPTIYHESVYNSFARTTESLDKKIKCHLKLDTGMSRLGLSASELGDFVEKYKFSENVAIDGVFTHLACADDTDSQFTLNQIDLFNEGLSKLNNIGVSPNYIHIANSAAIQKYPQSHGNLVRPGIMLYGAGAIGDTELRPAMKLVSQIVQIKEHDPGVSISYGGTFVTEKRSKIATIPIGYADGYMRKLSNKAYVSINGKEAPVVGTVCMDFIMVDITEIINVNVNDRVILFGDDIISIDDVAGWADTIPYEIMTMLGKRVPRVFV